MGHLSKLTSRTITKLFLPLALLLSQTAFANDIQALIAKEQQYATHSSVYITMRDGVKIAADIHLPRNYQPGQKLPTLLYQTIYQRSSRKALVEKPDISNVEHWQVQPKLENRSYLPMDYLALQNGYVLIRTDVRGTGASFGTRNSILPFDEILDNNEILDWIVAQPWSDGNVGTYGISYYGMTSGLAPVVKHPALKAVVMGWTGVYDEYKTIMQPFGFEQPGLVCNWSDYIENLWSGNWQAVGRSVMPVDGDENAKLLTQAIAEHKNNETVCDLLDNMQYSDDVISKDKVSVQGFSQMTYKQQIEASGVPMLTLASWYDAGAVDSYFTRLHDFSNEQKIFITGGQHGGFYHASPYLVGSEPQPPIPSGKETWQKALTFFDYHLKGIKNEYEQWPDVHYWNLGEEKFHRSGAWPLKNATNVRFYLNDNNSLTTAKPDEKSAFDSYKVNFDATTGKNSRWWTGVGLPMLNQHQRQQEDEKLLVYTSEPLTEDLQITGWPIVNLVTSSDHTDGAFIVYLEDVTPESNSILVNEGGIRAIHRKLQPNPVKGLENIPYQSFKKADAQLLTPHEVTLLKFAMIPTSVKIKKGHRIRIAIAGADKDNFKRIPANGEPTIKVYRNRSQTSYIDLPVIH